MESADLVVAKPTRAMLEDLFPIGPWAADEQLTRDLGALSSYLLTLKTWLEVGEKITDPGHSAQVRKALKRDKVRGFDNAIDLAPYLVDLTQEAMDRFLVSAAMQHSQMEIMAGTVLLGKLSEAMGNSAVERAILRRYPFIRFHVALFVAWRINVIDCRVEITDIRDGSYACAHDDEESDSE